MVISKTSVIDHANKNALFFMSPSDQGVKRTIRMGERREISKRALEPWDSGKVKFQCS